MLGATVQQTKYSESMKKILTDESKVDEKDKDAQIKVITGLNILSNNQVRVVPCLENIFFLLRIRSLPGQLGILNPYLAPNRIHIMIVC